jgi:predicted metal-binding membrane protein
MTLDEGARCARHEEAPAEAACWRCGTFLCARCAIPLGKEVVCGACLTHHARAPETSAQARAALYLGLAGLISGFLPGVVGLVLSYRELERIARGESSPGSHALARAGQLLGWLNAALLGGALLVLLSRWSG